MIVAIGTDLIEIERIRKVLLRSGERFLHRIFTPEERGYVARFADPAPSLAARFAAKEAFQKVWFTGHSWQDVWVMRDTTQGGEFPLSAPYLKFSPHIGEVMQQRNWKAHLSLTHTKDYASAVVVLEQI